MSTEVQAVLKVDSLGGATKRKKDSIPLRSDSVPGIMNKKHKTEDSKHFKFSKKRSQSFTGGKMFPPYKKRKKGNLIPPTKFLLGGNIRDPLNLNSLQDEEVNKAMNAVTPKSSPLPTPKHRKGEVEVIIPANINDPLSLAGGEDNDEAYAASFNTGHPHTPKKIKKKNKKRRSKGNSVSKDEPDCKLEEVKVEEVKEGETSAEVSLTEELDKSKDEEKEKEKEKEFKRPKLSGLEKREKKSGQEMKDRIVSPVIPQPGAWPGTSRFRKQGQRRSNQATPKFNEKSRRFQYGNYNRYYGYRNLGQESDPRLKVLARLQHFFMGRDVLDIGCNTGVISVAVARDLGARSVIGIDIDKSLVEAARQRLSRSSNEFPVSMPLVFGALDVPGVQEANTFPHNLTFIQGNYVLEDDVLVELEQAQFDVILCLSVTKWFHLNWGDDGLKRAFKRMFSQLRPGGVLILEPQDWSSYSRKKTLTETIWRNYQNIKFFPAKFTEYLLSEVGFSKCEVVGAPMHPQKGFQRPIKLFTKGETPPSQTPREDSQSRLAMSISEGSVTAAEDSQTNNQSRTVSDISMSVESAVTVDDVQINTQSKLASDVSMSVESTITGDDVQTVTQSRIAIDFSVSEGSTIPADDVETDNQSRLISDMSISEDSITAVADAQTNIRSRIVSDVPMSVESAITTDDVSADIQSRISSDISTSEGSTFASDVEKDTQSRLITDMSISEGSINAAADTQTNIRSRLASDVSMSVESALTTDDVSTDTQSRIVSDISTSEGSTFASDVVKTDTQLRVVSDMSISETSTISADGVQTYFQPRITSDISMSVESYDVSTEMQSRLASDISMSEGSSTATEDIRTNEVIRNHRDFVAMEVVSDSALPETDIRIQSAESVSDEDKSNLTGSTRNTDVVTALLN